MFRPVVAIIRFQVLSFDSIKIILYNSRGGVFDEEIIFLDQKLHVSAGSGHHQVLSFDSIILYNSRGGVLDEEISSSNTPPRELCRIIFSESNDKT